MDHEVDPENIKQLLVDADNKFYLLPSRMPGATYKVLWYTLDLTSESRPGKDDPAAEAMPESEDDSDSDSDVSDASVTDIPLSCKVDVLTPPSDLHVPLLTPSQVQFVNDIPVLPVLPLLLLKLQGWADHCAADAARVRRKQHGDVEDIDELLVIACDSGVRIEEETYLPQEFVENARWRIEDYVEDFPESMLYWITLGFELN